MSNHLSNRVAVLLAAYNGEAYLREQIETIINQVHVSVDIFISLDTSTDNSLELLRSLSSKHTNIKLLETGKTFGSAGQNFFHLLMDVDFLVTLMLLLLTKMISGLKPSCAKR